MSNNTFIPPNKKKPLTKKKIDQTQEEIMKEAKRRGIDLPRELLEIEDLLKDERIAHAVASSAIGIVKTIELAIKLGDKISIGAMMGMLGGILLKMEKENVLKMNRDNN